MSSQKIYIDINKVSVSSKAHQRHNVYRAYENIIQRQYDEFEPFSVNATVLTRAFLIQAETCTPFINPGNVVTSLTAEMILEHAPPPRFRIKIEMPECLKEPRGMSAPCLHLPSLYLDWRFLGPVDILSTLDTVEVYFGENNGTRRVGNGRRDANPLSPRPLLS